MRVVVTGVCAAGKTTLVTRLRELGIEAYNVAQEHSGIKDLWRKKMPDVLVVLDATLPVIRTRREVPWGEERLILQRERLRNARANAQLFIQTDALAKEDVVAKVVNYVKGRQGDGDHSGGSQTGSRGSSLFDLQH